MKGVIDTCFLVDWVDYKRRDILKLIFDEVILLSEIEKEISDQKVNILDEYQKETKRKYSTHFVQKLIKELEVLKKRKED